jgi:hypothetical protein
MRVAIGCVALAAAAALVGGPAVGAARANATAVDLTGCGPAAQTVLPLAGHVLSAADLHVPALPPGVTWTRPVCAAEPVASHQSGTALALNWAGYHAANFGAVASVTAHWVVPDPGRTPGTRTTYSNAWVGIGGTGHSTLVQAGSESDATCVSLVLLCAKRSTTEYLWYEIYPDEFVIRITNLSARIGDTVSSTVSYSRGVATFVVCNQTLRRCVNITQRPSVAPSADAEWIVERPTVGGVLPQLADFGSVTFTRPTFTVSRTTRAANAGSTIDMVSCRRAPMAHTNAYSTRSASFRVDWTGYGKYGC